MSIKSVWQKYIEDTVTGLPVAGASVEVRREADGTLATLYSDRDGAAQTNPITSDSNGLARFYADAGSYKVTATFGVETSIFRYVAIGDSSETDRVYQTSASPTALDDINAGFIVGQLWQDDSSSPSDYYMCEDNTAAAAVWTIMAIGDKLDKTVQVKIIPDTSYTVLDSDNGKLLVFTSATAVAFTVPDGLDSGDGDSTGFNFYIAQNDTGEVDWSGSPQTTINNKNAETMTDGQYSLVTFVSTSADVFISSGETA